MLDHYTLIQWLGLGVVAVPVLLVALLGMPYLSGKPLSERVISTIVEVGMVLGLLSSLGVLGLMLSGASRHVVIDLGNWVSLPSPEEHATANSHFHFTLKFVFDRLSVPFVILSFLLCGAIGAFANKYLHREPGFARFFMQYALFVMGMVMASLAGTIETLFFGWELVGVSSALLVAFFHERPAPVRNGLRVWIVYRISDAALLMAAVALHHLRGEGDFDALMGVDPWPLGHALLTRNEAMIIGSLLVIAAAGKSALVPFSGWLPRAMEGPTPSSAVFYGALSVHLGAFLLLRVSPILELTPWLSMAVVALGLVSALFGSLVGRVQTDVKSALSFASLTQVGLIVAEIGAGLRYIALIHILGHACLRTLQFLRASNILADYRTLEDAIGARLPAFSSPLGRLVPQSLRLPLYRLAIQRGYLDGWLYEYIASPFLRVFQSCDTLERRWTDFLSGQQSRESDRVGPTAGSLEDLSL
jgi:NADH:ubiquinone oxidoreductase subunit 5 (subunit L)/multisubunit Na+/H+ antiporter MnhA subunit